VSRALTSSAVSLRSGEMISPKVRPGAHHFGPRGPAGPEISGRLVHGCQPGGRIRKWWCGDAVARLDDLHPQNPTAHVVVDTLSLERAGAAALLRDGSQVDDTGVTVDR